MKILVVDDSKAMRMIVTRMLRKTSFAGSTFLEASNGVEGCEKVASESPDVVVSDWNMPEMNGLQFLEKIRSEGCDVPFGFVTTESTSAVRQQARDAGATFFITKPFTEECFETQLASVLATA